jgi:hypothetical protein
MFYDTSAKDEASMCGRPMKLFRLTMTGVIIVLLAPFVMFAMAPVVLLLVPLALVAMAFMLPAVVGGRPSNPVQSEHLQAWRLAPAMQA